MAFRTKVGQEYKAKSTFDNFIERQEERSRVGSRVENSIAHNAAQAAVLVCICDSMRVASVLFLLPNCSLSLSRCLSRAHTHFPARSLACSLSMNHNRRQTPSSGACPKGGSWRKRVCGLVRV